MTTGGFESTIGVVSTTGGVSAATGSLGVTSTGVDTVTGRSGPPERPRPPTLESFVFAGFTFTTGSAVAVDVSSRSTVTVLALTVLVGLPSPLGPESWSLPTSFVPVVAAPEGASAPGFDGADDDAASPPDESDSAAATPWPALSAMPAPAATTHTPRNQRFALTDGM